MNIVAEMIKPGISNFGENKFLKFLCTDKILLVNLQGCPTY